MAKITISDDKLSVQSVFTLKNIIIGAVILVLISLLFWTFAAFYTWIFITLFANVAYAGLVLVGVFMNSNQMEIDLGKKTLLQQSKLGNHVFKREEIRGITADSFYITLHYQNGKHYNLSYSEGSENSIVWSFKRSGAKRVNNWLNEHRKSPVEIG